MATLVSHAMRRYPSTSPGSGYSSHHNREHTNESSLSRSMRYAEPWLYGSVRAPQGLILTPALVLCSCPEYLTGTKRSSKKSPSVCKKCKGTRLPFPSPDTLRGTAKFGTVRCYPTGATVSTIAPTIRPGTVKVASKSRPSILPQGDPYELMRKSRLAPETSSHFSIRSKSNGNHLSSIVPKSNGVDTLQKLSTISSPVTPNNNEFKTGTVNKINKSMKLISPSEKFASVGRRSILECDINPYDLMGIDETKDNGVTLLNGQRIRVRPTISEQHYEEIKPSQIPKLKKFAKFGEKDPEIGPYKSILKKPTDSNSPLSSPSPINKSGSLFYLPTPRKKVQFLVEPVIEDEEIEQREENIEEIDVYEDVLEPCKEEPAAIGKKLCPLRRSISERHIQEPPKVQFNDTMALRTKQNRTDCRNAFSTVTDLQRLDGVGPRARQESSKNRPQHPPPPPPPSLCMEKHNSKDFAKSNIVPENEQPPLAPPRKRSNNKMQAAACVKISATPTAIEYSNKTVVQIKSDPTIHKIQIKNELPDVANVQNVTISDKVHQKTSIMINGDDCYSTVNINDNVSTYQSSVVVRDLCKEEIIPKTNKGSTVYITGNFITPTITESKETTKTDISLILKDPVEAVKRNLVPHVCGRSDMLIGQVECRKPSSSLLDDHLQSLSQIENPTTTLLHDSLLKLRNYDADYDSENGKYETMEGSDCYTDNSNRSSITEEEMGNRTKFYELLADSAIAEISENEDHHYESIRINSDPIYEEISPPPLPSNPPPSNILDDLQLDKQFTTRSIFEGASKYDILSYLVDAKERGIVPEDCYNFGTSDIVIEEDNKETNRFNRVSQMSDSSEDSSLVITNGPEEKSSKSAEIERNDSGVGSETSKSSLSRFRTKTEPSLNCEDCEVVVESLSENEPLICRKCVKKRSERKETIMEIVETEEKYSRDLQIILEEFYQPMLVAGLLTPDQLSAIFLNAEELLENSQALAERLRDAVEIALEQGDEDLLTVNIGKLFLEAAPMLHAFETYCVRQGSASLLLASLEKDKELLRIFLRVSQMENTMLRRMNLNSFLMVPVQRVTKYPLLLTRLYKTTPVQHETREQLKEAQHKIELHLNHMNSETKDVPSKLWRRIGSNSGRRSSSEMDLVSIKLRKIAVDVLEWNHDEAKFALEGKLLFTQPTDNNWRKGRTIKLAPVNALLVTHGKLNSTNRNDDDGLIFSRNSGIREAALILIRDKNGRYSLLREPLYLDKCIIATDPAWQSYFEVQEVVGKDTFIFKADDDELTKTWYRQLQFRAQGLGAWRKRRNALANIMINGMGLRA